MNRNPIKNTRNVSDVRPATHEAETAANRKQEGWPQQRPIAPVNTTRSGQTGFRRNAAPLGHPPDIAQESGRTVRLDCGGGKSGVGAAPAGSSNAGINTNGSPYPAR